MQQQAGEFSVKETITGQINSNCNNNECQVNKNHLLQNVLSLQLKVNNLNVDQKKFKVKQKNIFGLVLIDTGNLVHPSIVSGKFWEAIEGRINNTMNYKVGTADGQSKGLQVLGIGGPYT